MLYGQVCAHIWSRFNRAEGSVVVTQQTEWYLIGGTEQTGPMAGTWAYQGVSTVHIGGERHALTSDVSTVCGLSPLGLRRDLTVYLTCPDCGEELVQHGQAWLLPMMVVAACQDGWEQATRDAQEHAAVRAAERERLPV
jgi:hypothetical protein